MRVRATWLVLWALAFQLLLPLVHPAAAMMPGRVAAADAAIVCTAQGLEAVGDDATSDFRCPVCTMMWQAAAPPLAPAGPPLLRAATPVAPFIAPPFRPAQRPATPWSARGPPIIPA